MRQVILLQIRRVARLPLYVKPANDTLLPDYSPITKPLTPAVGASCARPEEHVAPAAATPGSWLGRLHRGTITSSRILVHPINVLRCSMTSAGRHGGRNFRFRIRHQQRRSGATRQRIRQICQGAGISKTSTAL